MRLPSARPPRLILNGKKAARPEVRAAGERKRAAAREGVGRVIAGGGDGSVHEIAGGLMALEPAVRPAFGILPLGTANDFASACGIPADSAAALELAVTGAARPVDLGRANDAWFVNVASGGFGACVTAATPVELKNFLGGGAYTLMGLVKALDFRPYACAIRTPEGCIEGNVVVGAVCNGRQAGGGQPLAPEALIDDGLLDVVFLRPFPVARAAQVVAEILDRGAPPEFVVRQRVPWIEVEARESLPINLDGEPIEGTHVRFAVEPGCVRLVLPPACPCVSRGG
jgi:lipid kinase YegS